MENVDFTNFPIPEGFELPSGQKASGGEVGGVNTFQYGKGGYVAFRFCWDARPWKADKVKKARIDASDTIPVIMFYRDNQNHIPVRLKRKMSFEPKVNQRTGEEFDKAFPYEKLPNESVLDCWELPQGFNSPEFERAFELWKTQGNSPGTPITNWRADPGQANTFAALGIFTVEQLGRLSEEKFTELVRNLPPSMKGALVELHTLAIAFVAAQEGNYDLQALLKQVQEAEDRAERAEEELESKQEEIEALAAKIKGSSSPAKKAKALPKKKSPSGEEEEGGGVSIKNGEIIGV